MKRRFGRLLIMILLSGIAPAQAAMETTAATMSWSGISHRYSSSLLALQEWLQHFWTSNGCTQVGYYCPATDGSGFTVIHGVPAKQLGAPQTYIDYYDNPNFYASFFLRIQGFPECPNATPSYSYNPVSAMCERQSVCPINDLPAITDPDVLAFEANPNLSDTTRLTPRMQTALSCLLTAAAAGSPTVGSAYRPPAYNQNLIDVWKKWNELANGDESANPSCTDLKTKIVAHFQRHGLLRLQQPVVGSLHTQGEAIDVTINLPAANIDTLAAGCQLRRPVPVADPVHFIHQ